MDLKYRIAAASCFILLSCSSLFAAAQLRLDTTALGPLSVAAGANGPTLTVHASNTGTDALNLTAASSATWLIPSVKAIQPCDMLGTCVPVTIGLNTASLAKGTYTGIVTLSDPNAIDAPQNITVTVNVGGGVPGSVTFYIPTNGNPVTQNFTVGARVSPALTQPSGGPAMSLALPAGTSFESTYSYTLSASAGSGVAEKSYTGSMVVAGSPVSDENKTVPVTLNVTSQPIAVASPLSLAFRIASNAAKQTQYVTLTNPGSGTLTLSGATATAAQSGTWLSASTTGLYVVITADPSGLQPGSYQGSIAIATNAANASITVPVTFDVVAPGPPAVRPGVVNNATFTLDTLAQGDFPALFGEQLTTGAPFIASDAPYPTNAGGATVYLNDQPVPLYYVSANQINFLVPYETAPGNATLRVDRDGQRGNTVSLKIGPSSPKLLLAANSAGQVVSGAVAGAIAPVHPGDYLVAYGFGFGATAPPVETNTATPLSPFSLVGGTNNVYFGQGGLFSNTVGVPPAFIGLSPSFISAFYQINVQIPANAPTGAAVPMFVQGDAGTTNKLLLNIQ